MPCSKCNTVSLRFQNYDNYFCEDGHILCYDCMKSAKTKGCLICGKSIKQRLQVQYRGIPHAFIENIKSDNLLKNDDYGSDSCSSYINLEFDDDFLGKPFLGQDTSTSYKSTESIGSFVKVTCDGYDDNIFAKILKSLESPEIELKRTRSETKCVCNNCAIHPKVKAKRKSKNNLFSLPKSQKSSKTNVNVIHLPDRLFTQQCCNNHFQYNVNVKKSQSVCRFRTPGKANINIEKDSDPKEMYYKTIKGSKPPDFNPKIDYFNKLEKANTIQEFYVRPNLSLACKTSTSLENNSIFTSSIEDEKGPKSIEQNIWNYTNSIGTIPLHSASTDTDPLLTTDKDILNGNGTINNKMDKSSITSSYKIDVGTMMDVVIPMKKKSENCIKSSISDEIADISASAVNIKQQNMSIQSIIREQLREEVYSQFNTKKKRKPNEFMSKSTASDTSGTESNLTILNQFSTKDWVKFNSNDYSTESNENWSKNNLMLQSNETAKVDSLKISNLYPIIDDLKCPTKFSSDIETLNHMQVSSSTDSKPKLNPYSRFNENSHQKKLSMSSYSSENDLSKYPGKLVDHHQTCSIPNIEDVPKHPIEVCIDIPSEGNLGKKINKLELGQSLPMPLHSGANKFNAIPKAKTNLTPLLCTNTNPTNIILSYGFDDSNRIPGQITTPYGGLFETGYPPPVSNTNQHNNLNILEPNASNIVNKLPLDHNHTDVYRDSSDSISSHGKSEYVYQYNFGVEEYYTIPDSNNIYCNYGVQLDNQYSIMNPLYYPVMTNTDTIQSPNGFFQTETERRHSTSLEQDDCTIDSFINFVQQKFPKLTLKQVKNFIEVMIGNDVEDELKLNESNLENNTRAMFRDMNSHVDTNSVIDSQESKTHENKNLLTESSITAWRAFISHSLTEKAEPTAQFIAIPRDDTLNSKFCVFFSSIQTAADLSIPRNPIVCPITTCNKLVFVSEFSKHIRVDHGKVPIECITPGRYKNFFLDSKIDHFGINKCQMLYLVANKIKDLGSGRFKDFLPVLVMSTRVCLLQLLDPDINPNDSMVKQSSEHYLMIWLTGLCPIDMPVYYSLTAWSRYGNIPGCHLVHTGKLYSLRSQHDTASLYSSGQVMILSQEQVRSLSNNGNDMIFLQIVIH